MTPKQTCIRFAHACGIRSSSQWRQGLSADHAELLENVAVFQSATALSFTAQSPQSSERLRGRAAALMRAVAAMAGQVLAVDVLDFTPGVAFTGSHWQYRVPRFVVARSGQDWNRWRAGQLDAGSRDDIQARIGTDLRKQLAVWGCDVSELHIALDSPGEPMALKNAVAFGPRPVSAMSRKDLVFSSSARIEGGFWTGLLQATGHGRIYRNGHQETDRDRDPAS
jgi:hypothetical protein